MFPPSYFLTRELPYRRGYALARRAVSGTTFPPLTEDPMVREPDLEDFDLTHIALNDREYIPGWRQMYCGLILPSEERVERPIDPMCEDCIFFWTHDG